MLKEYFKFESKPEIVDRANGVIKGVIIMDTVSNKNNDANFNYNNQVELCNLGNKGKVKCYQGHGVPGLTIADRLPYLIGYFNNFRIDGTSVKADLNLYTEVVDYSETLIRLVKSKYTDYIYGLAESAADVCGFSMEVRLKNIGNEDGEVSISNLYAVALVNSPALTDSMYSTNDPIEFEEIHPSLSVVDSLLNALDSAVKAGQPLEGIIAQLQQAAADLLQPQELEEPTEDQTAQEGGEEVAQEPTEAPIVEELAQAIAEEVADLAEEVQEAQEETTEAPATDTGEESQEPTEVDLIKQDIADIKEMFATLKAIITEMKGDNKQFAQVEEQPKTVVFSTPVDISITSDAEDKVFSSERYEELRKKDPLAAARYYKDNH